MYERIVVGTDGSAGADAAVDAAIRLASLTGATLHVVHAYRAVTSGQMAAASEVAAVLPVDIEATNEAIEAIGAKMCADVLERATRAGVRAEAHCVPGDPADALIAVAGDVSADLLVCGNRGMTGVRRFVLGSVPNKVSHHCPTNLLIVDTSQTRD
jgi:nucleotide-binding universal stress UspA family protein